MTIKKSAEVQFKQFFLVKKKLLIPAVLCTVLYSVQCRTVQCLLYSSKLCRALCHKMLLYIPFLYSVFRTQIKARKAALFSYFQAYKHTSLYREIPIVLRRETS